MVAIRTGVETPAPPGRALLVELSRGAAGDPPGAPILIHVAVRGSTGSVFLRVACSGSSKVRHRQPCLPAHTVRVTPSEPRASESGMSMVELIIGKLPDELEEAATAALDELGIARSTEWLRYDGPVQQLSLLNLASVTLFNDHVARLEGFKNSVGAEVRSRFKNLPYWEFSGAARRPRGGATLVGFGVGGCPQRLPRDAR